MNEGDSAGRRRNSTSPPAVVDRRPTQIQGIASAAPASQMSQLPASRLRVQSSESQNTNDSCSSSSSNSIITGSTAIGGCVKSNIGSSGGNANVLRSQHVHVTATTTPTSSSGANNRNGTSNELVSTTLSPLYTTTTVTVSNATVAQTPSASTTTTTTTFIGSHSGPLATIAKKRSANNTEADSIIIYKKRNLNHRVARLKQIKDKHTDHVAEIYFLQTGGNMMDYSGWRKKAHTPEFLDFIKRYRLDSPSAETAVATTSTPILTAPASIAAATASPTGRPTKSNQPASPIVPATTATTTTTAAQNTPHGVEIKIPGVGVTPVAISTTLPAAVAQLTQQGNVPGRPQGGRHGMVFGQIPVSSITVPLVPGGTPLVPDSPKPSTPDTKKMLALSTPTNTQTPNTTAGSSNGPQEQFLKVRQEASVMQRISELQREGLWTEKRLPKQQEPQRPKAHWDYLLEEMVWLAADFAQERKWKKAAAKKCARMVQKYFNDKALAAQKAEKAQELQLKRIAGYLAKEIKFFWSNVEKLVEYKQQTKIKEKRKKALDQHLSFIVDQTEKYSQQLAVGMNKSINDASTSAAVSLNSSRRSSPKHSAAPSDDEFSPGNASSDDDEETIAKEEEMDATDTKDEIAALQKESEMELDDLDFLSDYLRMRDKIVLDEDDEDTNMEASVSDKTTRKKIAAVASAIVDDESSEAPSVDRHTGKAKEDKMEIDSDDDSTAAEDDDDDDEEDEGDSDASEDDDEEDENDTEDIDAKNNEEEGFGLKSLLEEDANKQSQADKDDLINDAAAIAESIQPKGNTLSSTNVVTPVPFLLRHTLREYQHIGLDWLVTMHDRKLNGILADEMGLGKTIQTISLLAHLACVKGNWGPHLIVVPSSVMLNWEMEFKKWCPGFKILTYYGTQKERKQKRIGWTKVNAFHVCITSYKLVIQDHQSFRRKKWKYLILDEAQNIKNFKSQRWQLLLNFQTEQRLLLTGTPLQNNLMELWSLMHFLMPHVFQSHREFKEWFSNPMTGMIEGNSEYNDSIIKRLHKVLRPFLLRRLKSEVEKQMPKKYEHVVMCRLSKRQRFLYDDFMSRAKTRETLETGNFLNVINVLMQLRKVCNHPNMFETRPTVSPFRMDGINLRTASIVCNILDYDPFKNIDLNSLNLVLVQLEQCMSAYVAYRARRTQTPRKLIEEIDSAVEPPPKCPEGQFKMFLRIREPDVCDNLSTYSGGVKVGTSPAMKTEGTRIVPVNSNLLANSIRKPASTTCTPMATATATRYAASGSRTGSLATISIPARQISTPTQSPVITLSDKTIRTDRTIRVNRLTDGGRQIIITPANSGTTVVTPSGQQVFIGAQQYLVQQPNKYSRDSFRGRATVAMPAQRLVEASTPAANTSQLTATLAQQLKTHSYAATPVAVVEPEEKETVSEFELVETEEMLKVRRTKKLQFMAKINRRRCDATPIYGTDLRQSIREAFGIRPTRHSHSWLSQGFVNCSQVIGSKYAWSLGAGIKSIEQRTNELKDIFQNFVLFVPPVSAPVPWLHISHPPPSKLNEEIEREHIYATEVSPKMALLHPIISAMSTQFPDPRLIQYDCGKLQTLDRLLRQLKDKQHRVLIFTQMTRMLDVLEAFLNYHGHIYLRLDGTTRIEQRQILMDRFNNDKRIFAFILSTRSGGVGVNLTGADTVIFYDSDWNPTMDAQAQDRCHRIGQTRDVHIYRLVSEKTIEENILKKANQKRLLGDLAIEGGNFTTAYFKSTSIQELFNVNSSEDNASARLSEVLDRDRDRRTRLQENLAATPSTSTAATPTTTDERLAIGAFESALAAAEDEQDVQAAKIASAEADADLAEFDESIPIEDNDNNKAPEISKAEQEVENLVKQLSPIERYAMRFVEETGGSWTAEQLRAAEAEIEQQKREWEANRLATLKKAEEDAKRAAEEENEMLTYSREDAQNQIWISENTMEQMPMWCPPTPPQDDDSDLYIDYSLCFLYDQDVIPESELPPVYIKKEVKRTRADTGFFIDGRRPAKIRKEDNYFPPRSLFDRPSPALAKLRRDLKIQRYRGNFKPLIHLSGMKQQQQQQQHTQLPAKTLVEPEGMAEWHIHEDMALLNIIQNMQGLPLNLMLLSPGHTPNWDLVCEVVNQTSRVHRTAKQCRYRYEAVIVPREEGKLIETPKKQPKKSKNPLKATSPPKGIRALRTSQLFINDNNATFTKLVKQNFEFTKAAYMKKAPQLKQVLVNPSMKNPKHASLLVEYGVTNYESPLNPIEIAARRAGKMKSQQQQQQQQQQPQSQQQQQVQPPQAQQQQQPQAQQQTQSQTPQPVQPQQQTLPQPQPQPQTQTQPQQQLSDNFEQFRTVSNTFGQFRAQQQQGPQPRLPEECQTIARRLPDGNRLVSEGQSPTSRLVQQPQIVKVVAASPLHPSPPTQATANVQISSPSQTVATVSQLATVGTVFTTSGLPSNAVATLTTSALRPQRIVTAPALQEMVFTQRTGSQSPTVVSVSGLTGQSVSQAQLQTGQLRLSMSGSPQVSGVVTKGGIPIGGIPIGAITAGKPIGAQPAQFQIVRQNAARQQFKVLNTAQGNTVLQTVGGQVSVVNPTGAVVVHNRILNQRNNPNRSDNHHVIVQHQHQQQHQQQQQQLQQQPQPQPQQRLQHVHPQQSSLFTSGVGGQQHIATLVKTSTGAMTTTGGTVGMTLAQIKTGQLKATLPNTSTPVRQMQLQQIPIAQQQRKAAGKMTQITQVAGTSVATSSAGGNVTGTVTGVTKGSPIGTTQLIVQNPKNLQPGTVTVQQIQQVMRQQPNQIVVGKNLGRIIPVSVSSQPNARQTIQVVSAASAQGLTAGTIRTNMANAGMGTTHTIKVAAGTTPQQTQAIFNALQQQQQMQRQNSGQNLRLQTGGSLVAVTVQPQAIVSQQSSTESVDSTAGTSTTTTAVVQSSPQNQSQQPAN